MEWENMRGVARLFEFVPDTHFWIKDRDGRFVACNRSFAGHVGLPAEALIGRTDFDVSARDLARAYVEDDRKVIASGRPLEEKLELVRERDHTLRWYSVTKAPLRDARGVIMGTAGFLRKVDGPAPAPGPARGLDLALERMRTGFASDLTISGLARLAGMSEGNFARRMKERLRETPLRHLNRLRMRAACGLLVHTDLPVAEVAARSGFPDPSYFAKRFRAYLRIGPQEYRRKFGKGAG